VCLHLGFNVALSGFLFLLLLFIISEGLFNASWRRNEGAGGGVAGKLIGPGTTRNSFLRILVGRSVVTHAVQRVQIQTLVP
jgi:hypothetical protein